MSRTINDDGLALIKNCEGCRLDAYRDVVGVWTIGYGHTPSFPGQAITQEQAGDLLCHDLSKFCGSVEDAIEDTPTSDAQFSAMVSLAYNIGVGAFTRSTVLRRHLDGDYTSAGNAFLMWNKAGGQVVPGLLKRRYQERDLYLSELPEDEPQKPVGFWDRIKALFS